MRLLLCFFVVAFFFGCLIHLNAVSVTKKSNLPLIDDQFVNFTFGLKRDVPMITDGFAPKFKRINVQGILYQVFLSDEGNVLSIKTCDEKFVTPNHDRPGVSYTDLEKQYEMKNSLFGLELADGWTALSNLKDSKNVECFIKRKN